MHLRNKIQPWILPKVINRQVAKNTIRCKAMSTSIPNVINSLPTSPEIRIGVKAGDWIRLNARASDLLSVVWESVETAVASRLSVYL